MPKNALCSTIQFNTTRIRTAPIVKKKNRLIIVIVAHQIVMVTTCQLHVCICILTLKSEIKTELLSLSYCPGFFSSHDALYSRS